jgi:hypothetical protein
MQDCEYQRPADSIKTSYESIQYCLAEDAHEDVANHLISFSLSKIIAILSPYVISEFCPLGIGTDAVLRASLRRFMGDPTSGNLLCYLNVAQRAGLNVYQIDDSAWLVALDIILVTWFDHHLDSILLFGKPLDFISTREEILTKWPQSDINKDALGHYQEEH